MARKKSFRKKLNSELVRQRLKLKNLQVKGEFLRKYPGVDLSRVRTHSAKVIGIGALAGSLFLAPPAIMYSGTCVGIASEPWGQ